MQDLSCTDHGTARHCILRSHRKTTPTALEPSKVERGIFSGIHTYDADINRNSALNILQATGPTRGDHLRIIELQNVFWYETTVLYAKTCNAHAIYAFSIHPEIHETTFILSRRFPTETSTTNGVLSLCSHNSITATQSILSEVLVCRAQPSSNLFLLANLTVRITVVKTRTKSFFRMLQNAELLKKLRSTYKTTARHPSLPSLRLIHFLKIHFALPTTTGSSNWSSSVVVEWLVY